MNSFNSLFDWFVIGVEDQIVVFFGGIFGIGCIFVFGFCQFGVWVVFLLCCVVEVEVMNDVFCEVDQIDIVLWICDVIDIVLLCVLFIDVIEMIGLVQVLINCVGMMVK